MKHLSTSQICATLPNDVWDLILAKTDPFACLIFGRDDVIAKIEGWSHAEDRRWLRKAIWNGHLGVVRALYQKNDFVNIRDDALNLAAEYGHLHIIMWLPIEMCKKRAMNQAAKNGYLEVVKWLHENRKEGCTTYAMDWAARNGHLEVDFYKKRFFLRLCRKKNRQVAARKPERGLH